MPFAAFFVAFLLLLCIPRRSRKLALCLLLGALAGLCAVHTTSARLECTRANYAGRTVLLTAEVERADSNYFSDTVDATLWVESVNGSPAGFRITCAKMPACAAGQRVQGWFALQQPDMEEQTAQYTDGIALQAEPLAEKPQLTVLGESGSFRARTHRLQQKLSESLRRAMNRDTGGVLAAMTVGDRSGLSAQLRSAYRGAGLSHVLVVSGMHISILCGDILSVLLPYRWEQSYRSRRRRTVWKSLLALVLMGVTGFTPSVRRAAVAVWVSALGVWVWGPPDALTSLTAAGILMTAVNSYAVWDIGFELSFAAVVGTVAGNACIRRMRDAHDRRFWVKAGENLQKPVRRPWYSKLPKGVQGLVESACIAACASAATFPVLVLRGLSVSAWAVVSSIAVLWMVQPLLLLGLAVAFVGLVPWLAPVHGVLSRVADLLTGLLNGWAVWLSTKPGASIYFDTAYAALVCLLLCGLGVLAFRWRVRLRVALPGILLAAVVGIGLGNALQPGRGAHRPCGQRAGTCGGGCPERPGSGTVPGRQRRPACGGKPAGTAGRAHRGAGGRPAHECKNRLYPARAAGHPGRASAGQCQPQAALHPGGGGTAAHPGRVSCAAEHRQPAVCDLKRQGRTGAAAANGVADCHTEKAGDGAVPKAAGAVQLQLDAAGNAVHSLPQPAPHRRRKARVMLCNPGRVWYNTKSIL